MTSRQQTYPKPRFEDEDFVQIHITSVMHCATHFVMFELLDGWADWSSKAIPERGRGYTVRHLDNEGREAAIGMDCPVVVPVRDPHAVVRSCQAKGRKVRDISAMFDNLWILFQSRRRTTFCVPVDSPQRERFLYRLWENIPGVNLDTDWPIVRYEGKSGDLVDRLDSEWANLTSRVVTAYRSMFVDLGYGF